MKRQIKAKILLLLILVTMFGGLRYMKQASAQVPAYTLTVMSITGCTWGTYGSSPYLDYADGTSYIGADSPNNKYSGTFAFSNISYGIGTLLTVESVTLHMIMRHSYPLSGRELVFHINDGILFEPIGSIFINSSSWTDYTYNLTSKLNTVDKVNSAELRFYNAWSTPSYAGLVDYASLEVILSGEGVPFPWSISIVEMDASKTIFSGNTYTFRATYIDGDGYNDLRYKKIAFYDEKNWINATHYNDSFYLESGEGLVTVGGTTSVLGADVLQVDFRLFLTNSINDASDIDIYMFVDDNENNTFGWIKMKTSYFNIFNKGGYTIIERGGNSSGRLIGGDTFDLYADENSWVRVNQTWTNLKFIDAIFAINPVGNATVDEGNGGNMHSIGFFWFGMDAYDPITEKWSGWYAKVEVWDSYMGWATPNTIHSYVIYKVKWYMNGVYTGKQDFVAGYWEGKSSPNNFVRMHLRAWFNKANSSSVIGGWMSPAYYGVETGNAWDWITGGWIPKKTYTSSIDYPCVNTFLFNEFYDSEGKLLHYGDFSMQRFWVMVNRTASNPDYRYEISFTQKLDYMFSSSKEGIDTPEPLEPMLPDIPQGGIFGWIASTLGNLATSVFNVFSGGFSVLARVIVGGIDALLGFIFGTPNMFSGFLTAISNYLSQLGYMVANAGTFLSNIVTLFVNFFSGLGNVIINGINMLVWWITQLIMVIPNMIIFFSDMWNGTGMFEGSIALKDMATIIGLAILMWFTVGISVHGIGWGIQQIEMLMNISSVMLTILMWFFNVLVQIVQFVLSFIPFVG
jgi:hypothetical protein